MFSKVKERLSEKVDMPEKEFEKVNKTYTSHQYLIISITTVVRAITLVQRVITCTRLQLKHNINILLYSIELKFGKC